MKNPSRITKPRGKAKPLTAEMIQAITTCVSSSDNAVDLRDFAIFRVGIDTMLRVSDITRILIGDIQDQSGDIVVNFTVGQKKTKGRPVTCHLTEATREALRAYIATLPIADRRARLFPLCTRTVQRVVKRLVGMTRVDTTRFSPHSLRRTKASIIYKKTNNIEAVRQLLGHTSTQATSAYLDVSVNDAMAIAADTII